MAVLALGATGLSACSASSPTTAQATGASASCGKQGTEGSTKGPATISVAYSSTQKFNAGYQVVDFFSELKKDFQAAHPGVTVKLVPIGGSYSNFEEKVELMLRSPATAADVIHEWTQQVGGQVEAGELAPLESYLKSWPDWKQFPELVRLGGVPGPQVWQMVSGINDFGLAG